MGSFGCSGLVIYDPFGFLNLDELFNLHRTYKCPARSQVHLLGPMTFTNPKDVCPAQKYSTAVVYIFLPQRVPGTAAL